MRWLVLVIVVALAGCPKPIPPSPFPSPDGIPYCVPPVAPSTSDVCDGIFTADGAPCVNCGAIGGCYDSRDAVYCVGAGGCLSDDQCSREADTPMRSLRQRSVKHESH